MGKLLNNSIAKGATVLTVSKFICLAVTMVASMLLSRFRTLEEYGTYSQIITVVTLAESIFLCGLPNSLNYFIPKANNQTEKDDYLTLYFSLTTVLSLLAGVVLLLLTPVICAYYKNDGIKIFAYLLLFLPLVKIINGSYSNMMVASGKENKVGLYNILHSVGLLGSIIFVKIFNFSFQVYMISYLLVEVVFSIWVYIEARGLIEHINYKQAFGIAKKVLAFSLPIGIAGSLGTINTQLDHLMIGHFFDTEFVAVYSNAAKELPFNIIALSFSAVVLPRISKLFKNNESEKAVHIWNVVVEFNFIILAFCSIMCFVFAPQIVTVLYSSKYIGGVNIFRVYSLTMLARVTYFGMLLNANGKTNFILYSSLISLVMNLVLNWLFIQWFGAIGAAIATLICIFCVQFAQLFFSCKIFKIKFSSIFPWKNLAVILLINIVLGAVCYAGLEIFSIGYDVKGIIIAVCIGVVALITYFALTFKRLKTLLGMMNEKVAE